MKLAFYKIGRLFCPLAKYVLSVLLCLSVSLIMTCEIVPVCVSLLVSYIGFTDEATVAVVLLMAGIPGMFMAGLLLFGTVKFLTFGCRRLAEYFDGMSLELTRKIDLAN